MPTHKCRPLPVLTEEQAARFLGMIKAGNPDECWPWIKGRTKAQYGEFWVSPEVLLSHRIAWMLANGKDPHPLEIMHTCDNPPCCNPAHLIACNSHENMLDKAKKDRRPRVLTFEAVADIRQRYNRQMPGITKMLASEHGVSNVTILNVVKRKTFSYLP